jgi:hypothetical protein
MNSPFSRYHFKECVMLNRIRTPDNYRAKVGAAGVALVLVSVASSGQVTTQGRAAPPVADVLFVTAGDASPCGPVPALELEPVAPVVKDAPYSGVGVSEVITPLADGNRIVRKNVTRVFRDSRGRTRTEYELNAVGPFTLEEPGRAVVIFDAATSKRYVLHPAQKVVRVTAAVQSALPDSRPVVSGPPSTADIRVAAGTDLPGCGQFTKRLPEPVQLGERTIEGIPAAGTRLEFRIEAGEIGNELPIVVRAEHWMSSELGVVLESSHNDPLVGATRYKLTQIRRSEPDPGLFKVPADYTVRPGP